MISGWRAESRTRFWRNSDLGRKAWKGPGHSLNGALPGRPDSHRVLAGTASKADPQLRKDHLALVPTETLLCKSEDFVASGNQCRLEQNEGEVHLGGQRCLAGVSFAQVGLY